MISYIKGDLFTHYPSAFKATILAHSCHCRGSWGAGVAKAFQTKFPSTFAKYYGHCEEHSSNPANLLGTSLLIEPSSEETSRNKDIKYYVACFFTSDHAGAMKLTPSEITKHTDFALEDLKVQLQEQSSIADIGYEVNDGKIVINMPKINAGLFEVPWEQTEKILNKHEDFFHFNVYVL